MFKSLFKSLLNLDDYLNTLMLHTALNIDHTKDPSSPCNNLEKLPPLPTSLQYLNCYSNNLTELPPLPPSLQSQQTYPAYYRLNQDQQYP